MGLRHPQGLAYIHSHQPPIVHRDIKPANVKRTPTGDVVLLDFGLAKGRLDDDETASSGPNSMYGFTLQYAPPEQIDGLGTDVRSDLFALGATLYHLATGVQPASALHRSLAVKNGMPDPLVPADEIYPAVGPVLSAALTKALQLDPDDRFASAGEMRRRAVCSSRRRCRRRAEPVTAERRVDAALPSQVEVGRQTDLIVQVRFADSPRLGIEDWPTARRPERVEQQSEPLHVKHIVDVTGRLLPARVRIRVVAADFAIEGDAERVIEVPVNDYSKRMTFLLTSQRAGYCRVNVEVYALDSLFLGAVAVEAEAVSTHVAEAMPNVANVVLGTFARRAPTPKPAARGTSATADTVRIKITPELAAALAEPPAPAAAQQELTAAATIVADAVAGGRLTSAIERCGAAATAATAGTAHNGAHRAGCGRTGSTRHGATRHRRQRTPLAMPPPVLSPAATPPSAQKKSLSARITAIGGAVAAVVIAGVVIITWPAMRSSVTEPIVESPPTASAPTASTSPPPAPVAACASSTGSRAECGTAAGACDRAAAAGRRRRHRWPLHHGQHRRQRPRHHRPARRTDGRRPARRRATTTARCAAAVRRTATIARCAATTGRAVATARCDATGARAATTARCGATIARAITTARRGGPGAERRRFLVCEEPGSGQTAGTIRGAGPGADRVRTGASTSRGRRRASQ